jgi:hypothetical protein
MTRTTLSTVVCVGSFLVAAGVSLTLQGLIRNEDIALGVGILVFCATLYRICTSEGLLTAWMEADDED